MLDNSQSDPLDNRALYLVSDEPGTLCFSHELSDLSHVSTQPPQQRHFHFYLIHFLFTLSTYSKLSGGSSTSCFCFSIAQIHFLQYLYTACLPDYCALPLHYLAPFTPAAIGIFTTLVTDLWLVS